jgi:electron transfer flavoprotein-quinone oxidoreductase
MSDKFDVIVIGAGISGCISSYCLSKQGISVLLIDRGIHPGSKNVSKGLIYDKYFKNSIPNFYDKAPIERIITKKIIFYNNSKKE